jgi:hypothetical protein
MSGDTVRKMVTFEQREPAVDPFEALGPVARRGMAYPAPSLRAATS